MDISFHYFAVKTIARAAGYNEEKAQRIATFSQFIDDYNWYSYFRVGNIPDYIKDERLDIINNEALKVINPVTTGFIDWVDMATLILPRSQKYTVAAFHFIPQDKPSVDEGNLKTVPATLNDGSYISGMLRELKADIKLGRINENDALMKMGMLFHTFADTHAHQLFTGYNNKVNSVKIHRVHDNVLRKDVTNEYRFWVDQWISKVEKIIKVKMPTIGHMAIVHVPDLTHLEFDMEYTGYDGNTYHHIRSNTSTYVNVCKQLYDYMREILGDDIPANIRWDVLSEMLAEGFLVDASKELNEGEAAAVIKLKRHWSNIFTHFKYDYNSEQIKKDFVTAELNDTCIVNINGVEMPLTAKNYSDDFFKFNYFADLHLIKLYGDHPRNWFSSNEADDNVID